MTAPSQAISSVRLVHRTLTRAEAACLHEELKSTANILGYTIKELLRFSDVLVAEAENGTFAGACISKDLLFGWTDIAVLYILPAFRGQGISTQLYSAAFASAEERGRHIYTLSRSPEVIHLMERMGMKMTRSIESSPFAVHLYTQYHMMSFYRWKEVFRKVGIRQVDGNRFMVGMKRRTPE